MATTSKLLRMSTPLRLNLPSSSANNSSTVRCLGKAESNREKNISGSKETRSQVAVKASTLSETLTSSEPQTKGGVNLTSLVADVADTIIKIVRPIVKPRPRRLEVQMLIEKVIIDCRFFTLFAVFGSLLGSVLCFIEGCFIIIESYVLYFYAISQKPDQGHVVQLLIEGLDMFLAGTAMLVFGMGLYGLFVSSKNMKGECRQLLPASNFFGLFHLRALPAWLEIESVEQAKSKIGHAVMMLLQVGVLEKFKNVPLVNALDLACFSGAIVVSSACVFILSKLSASGTKGGRWP